MRFALTQVEETVWQHAVVFNEVNGGALLSKRLTNNLLPDNTTTPFANNNQWIAAVLRKASIGRKPALLISPLNRHFAEIDPYVTCMCL